MTDLNELLAVVEQAKGEEHERIAKAFHDAYERLAPEFGYVTRKPSAVPWEDVPEANRKLMIAVVEEVVSPLLWKLRRRCHDYHDEIERLRDGSEEA